MLATTCEKLAAMSTSKPAALSQHWGANFGWQRKRWRVLRNCGEQATYVTVQRSRLCCCSQHLDHAYCMTGDLVEGLNQVDARDIGSGCFLFEKSTASVMRNSASLGRGAIMD
jgi:hypothetical protein